MKHLKLSVREAIANSLRQYQLSLLGKSSNEVELAMVNAQIELLVGNQHEQTKKRPSITAY